eukprot:GHRQ01015494.1.p1 GENE.GHRQ01015494.1~~GHRQ01015494.1.p1  ORF type:complete len:173 (+),score=43.50 GHRQ01015494.1:2035-2553(+)
MAMGHTHVDCFSNLCAGASAVRRMEHARLTTSCSGTAPAISYKPGRFPATSLLLLTCLPQVLEQHGGNNAFCKYNDPLLQLFVSVLFLAGIVGAFMGSFTAKRWGRRPTMMLGGLCFLAGAVLMAPAVHVAMLIFGRLVMGLGEAHMWLLLTALLWQQRHAWRQLQQPWMKA